jgi:acylphosphatase
MIARRLTVHGKVQGVFYRNWAIANARELGLTGWVRNRPDGTVEAQLQGDEALVGEMTERMRLGPPRAVVERIEQHESPTEALTGFDRR